MLRYKLPYITFPSTLVGRNRFLYAGQPAKNRVLTPFPLPAGEVCDLKTHGERSICKTVDKLF